MVAEVMTREDLAATPQERRYYVCQQCGHTSTDPTEFKMIAAFKIGFVMCKSCLTEGENE